MKNEFRKTLSDISHPKLLPRKKRFFWGVIIGPPFSFLLLHLYYRMPVMPSVLISLLFGAAFIGLFIWEICAEKKYADLKNRIESGVYYEQEQWLESYRQYRAAHDFRPVKANSLKADLNRHYLRPAGIVMISFAMCMLLPAVFWRTGIAELNGFLAVGGLIFLVWGLVILLRTPVRKFLRSCGDELPHIERSYLNGKTLKYKQNVINIGGNYTVMLDASGITAADNRRITAVTRGVRRTRHFINQMYAGSELEYRISIQYQDADGRPCTRSLRLNEFQAEMAYEALAVFRKPASYDEKTMHEIG